MHLVLGVLILSSLALSFGLVQNQRARTLRDWAARMKADLAARDLAQSALAEATFEVMDAVNRPGTEFFAALRAPDVSDLRFHPQLKRCRDLLATNRLARGVEGEVRVHSRKHFPGGNDQDQEWAGQITVTVRVVAACGPGFASQVVIEGIQERELRATSIAPPRPLDRWCHYQAGIPSDQLEPSIPAGVDAPSFPLSRALMEAKASLRIDGDPNEGWRQLRDRLGDVNGTVYVNNPGQPLILRGLVQRGKTVLVTRGPVVLSDIRRDSRDKDQLVVIAFGDVSVDGRVEAVLIATQDKDDRPPSRSFRPHTRLVGGLVVTMGTLDAPEDAGVECDLDHVASGNVEGPMFLDRVFVSVSPQLIDSRLVVRS